MNIDAKNDFFKYLVGEGGGRGYRGRKWCWVET